MGSISHHIMSLVIKIALRVDTHMHAHANTHTLIHTQPYGIVANFHKDQIFVDFIRCLSTTIYYEVSCTWC